MVAAKAFEKVSACVCIGIPLRLINGYFSYKQLTNQQSLKTSNKSFLFLSYAKEHTKTNFKSECKLKFNCVLMVVVYALLVHGVYGLRSQIGSTRFNRKELFHLIMLCT